MPKTRRNRKGGKRRKSMKGGDGDVLPDIGKIAANVKESSGFPTQLTNLTNALREENEKSKAKVKTMTPSFVIFFK